MSYTVMQAMRDLPFPLVKWSEELSPQEGLDVLVVCESGGQQLQIRMLLSWDQIERAVSPDAVMGHLRAQVVDLFRRAHPERLPKGMG